MKLTGLCRDAIRFFCVLFLVATVLPAVGRAQVPDFSNPPPPRREQPKARQPARPNTVPRKPVARKRSNQKQSKFPAPEVVTLDTKDGVALTCTWFAPVADGGDKAAAGATPAGMKGRTTSPFILMHDWDRSRQDLLFLGRFLQLSGHAVIVPDLRGHGESLKVTGVDKPLDRARFRKSEMKTILFDIEACKKFLMRKNDEGVLNIDLLNLVAVGKSSVLAMQWAVGDWSWAPVGSVKQGQDVKSLILIAPERKLKSAAIKPMLKHSLYVGGPADPLPLLIVHAAQNKDAAEVSKDIYDGIKKGRSRYAKAWRAKMADAPDPKEDIAEQNGEDGEPEPVPPPPPIDPMKTFVLGPVPNQSQPGSELIASPQSQGVFRFIERFVQQAVLSRQAAYPWQKRLGK